MKYNQFMTIVIFFLKYANILHKMASILTLSCQKVLQIMRTIADVGFLESLYSKTPNCQPVNNFFIYQTSACLYLVIML